MGFNPMFVVFLLVLNITWAKCDVQVGPDPWDYVSNVDSVKHDEDIPPDLRITPTKKVQNNIGAGEWFYKRILAIILKGGKVKVD